MLVTCCSGGAFPVLVGAPTHFELTHILGRDFVSSSQSVFREGDL